MSKEVKKHYKGEIKVEIFVENKCILTNSKKWFHIIRNKRELQLTPEKYSLTKQRYDNFIYINTDNQTIYYSIQSLQDDFFYAKKGIKSNDFGNDIFQLVTFEKESTKINYNNIRGKAVCFDLECNNKFYCCKFYLCKNFIFFEKLLIKKINYNFIK